MFGLFVRVSFCFFGRIFGVWLHTLNAIHWLIYLFFLNRRSLSRSLLQQQQQQPRRIWPIHVRFISLGFGPQSLFEN